jgi:hypothetical protein
VEGRRRPFRNAGPLRPLLADLLDKAAEERPNADEIRQRLIPIARGSEPVPAFVINGPTHGAPEGGDAGLEDVSGTDGTDDERAGGTRAAGSPLAAAHLRAIEEEISNTSSDELSGLEAVSQEPFPRARSHGARGRSGENRRSLLIAAIAAMLVVGAAIAVSLLLTKGGKPSNLPPITVNDQTSSVAPAPSEAAPPAPAAVETTVGPTVGPTRRGTVPRTTAPPSASSTPSATAPVPPTSAAITTPPPTSKSATVKPTGGTGAPTTPPGTPCDVLPLCPTSGNVQR